VKRIPIIAGNWKMNKTEREALTLVRVLMQWARGFKDLEILICPPFTSLSQLHKLLVSSPIQLGAQNISDQPAGAYTGEISALMVKEFCTHVILGHSERRAYYREDDVLINRKLQAARSEGLIPVLCIGESLEENEAGQTSQVLIRQLKDGLEGVRIDHPDDLIIAYEPVWAIGTGRSASPQGIAEVISSVIRPTLAGLWGGEKVQGIRVLYGGSVKPENAGAYFSQIEIDGALVGGASLDPQKFMGIIERTQ
jgi:triosephosphate isomerase